MPTYADLLDVCLQRAGNLGLGQDAAELELYLFQALLDLVETTDIPAYLHYDQTMGVTTIESPQMALPPEFGRLIIPRAMNKRGIVLVNGNQKTDLTYLDPNVMTRTPTRPSGPPTHFTTIGDAMWFAPVPGALYTVQGLYIKKVERFDLDDPVVLPYPAVLIEQALFRLAGDKNKMTPSLMTTRQEAMGHLVIGSR